MFSTNMFLIYFYPTLIHAMQKLFLLFSHFIDYLLKIKNSPFQNNIVLSKSPYEIICNFTQPNSPFTLHNSSNSLPCI